MLGNQSGGPAGGGHDPYIAATPAPANIVQALQNVPASELAAAGNGSATVGAKASGANLIRLSGKPLSSGGKPEIVYLGSEYCPFCAATRWPLTIALDRFGSFTGLETTASTPLDTYPDTHTLSYATAKYTSKYIVFNSTEELSNVCPTNLVIRNTSGSGPAYECSGGQYKPLQSVSKSVATLASTIDSVAYFGSLDQNGAGIPFIDFGGKYAESGAVYDAQILQGASWSQIIRSFQVPNEGVGQAILGAANKYTAMICKMTGDKPGSVCSSSFVKAAEKSLG
ncbi:MAG: DUF929 family protein [Acidimicrobiales bacterium]